MINRTQAQTIVLDLLESNKDGVNYAIEDVEELENGDAWIVYYNSKEFIEGDTRAFLMGNSPLIVNKQGQVFMTGTGDSLDTYIQLYIDGKLEPIQS